MPDKPQSHFDRFLRPILASRFITISALIHLLLIFLVGGKVLFDRYVEPPDFQPTGDTSSILTEADSSLPPPPSADATLPAAPSNVAPPPPTASAALTAMTTLNPNQTSFSIPAPDIAPPTLSNDLSQKPAPTISNGPSVELPSSMAGRGAGRAETGRNYGEEPQSEQTVMRALRYLQSQQRTDGTWGSDQYQRAFTGLALLCYLGHGDTPGHSAEFSVVVTNAIDALLRVGTANGGHFCRSPDFSDHFFLWHPSAYEHGIATYALCEAYTMTKDNRLVPLIKQAVGFIVSGQRSDGGWGYSYDTSPDGSGDPKSDTSVGGWQIQALKAAHMTGIPGMDDQVQPILAKSMKWLDHVFNDKDGTFGYRRAEDRDYTLTGVGVLAKLFWLGRPDRTVQKGIGNIRSKNLNYDGPDCSLYSWYYDTQACYQAQGVAWEWWNGRFQNILTSKQSADGSWPVTGGNDIGDFTKQGTGDGALYRTALCTLMLEVYYRYLPTTESDALGGASVNGL